MNKGTENRQCGREVKRGKVTITQERRGYGTFLKREARRELTRNKLFSSGKYQSQPSARRESEKRLSPPSFVLLHNINHLF